MSKASNRPPTWRNSMTRRRFLRDAGIALGAALTASGLAGCGGSNEQPASGGTAAVPTPARVQASPTAAGAAKGGTNIQVENSQFRDLHPQEGGGSYTGRYVHDRLVNYDHINGKYELSLAQTLENPDPLTYIFKIKPSARFQNLPPVNGRNVTSTDVVASWEANTANPRATGQAFFKEYIDHYEKPDEQTLIIKMTKPNAWTISAQNLAASVPPTVVPKELIDQNLLQKTAVGCGPYVLESFDPASEVVFKRRPDAWHTPSRPYIDRAIHRVITDSAARAAALRGKQIDILAARDKLEADEFKTSGAGLEIDRELTHPAHIHFRSDDEGYFKDVRVREAIYNGLDIQELIDRVELGEGEWTGPVPVWLEGWRLPKDELKKVYPKDLQKAKQLLTAAGWDTNLVVEYKYPSNQKSALLAEIVQKQLAAIGIKTKLVPQDALTVWQTNTWADRGFQITSVDRLWAGVGPDPFLMHQTTAGRGGGNQSRFSDAEIDKIVAVQQVEFDAGKQKQLILDAQRLMLRKFVPNILLYCPYQYTGRWAYYHYLGYTMGYLGSLAHYNWIDVAHPGYPRDRK